MDSARYASLGLELGISVLIGLFGGRWIDGRFDTAPWGMLIGMVLGLTAGVRSIYRTVTSAKAAGEAADREELAPEEQAQDKDERKRDDRGEH